MKRALYSLFLLLSFSSLLSQETTDDYRPFIEEGKEWLLIGDYLGEVNGQSQVTVWMNYIKGDTIISGHLCKKWFQEDSRYNPERKVETLAVYAYEANKQVWFFHDGMTTPELMFDFGAEVGDTLKVFLVDAFVYRNIRQVTPHLIDKDMRDTIVIIKKDLGKEGDLFERRIWFTSIHTNYCSSDLERYNYLMEGVGLWARPNWNIRTYPGMNGSLFSCSVGDRVLYFDAQMAESADFPIPSAITSLPNTSVNSRAVQDDVSYFKNSLFPNLFDLSGRRLSVPSTSSVPSVLPKGVYIEKGKKRVKVK